MLNPPTDDITAKRSELEAPPKPPVELGAVAKSPNLSFQTLAEATERQVSELDLARYAKEDFTTNMEKNIMHRMFNSFDMLTQGKLNKESLEQLVKYLGAGDHSELSTSLSELAKHDVTFEAFWQWWTATASTVDSAKRAFAMVSAEFSVPFHEMQLLTEESGEKFTPNYRINFFFKNIETGEVKRVSPWHDIPLHVRSTLRVTAPDITSNRFNFICEIPKWSRAKFEINTHEEYNPIKQDMKNGVPRFYKHGDMMWNYGAFPQTWESTSVEFLPGVKGDKDPIDGIEIGMMQMKTGQVAEVKVLGVLGMIDDGEMDWKLILISHRDPIARFLHDIDDVPKALPGCLDALREWLRVYKICQGGVENKFAFDGVYQNRAFALKILNESHLMWNNLKKINSTTAFGPAE